MSRTKKNAAPARKVNTTGNRPLTVVEDVHYHAPKKGSRKPKAEPQEVTLEQLMAESGETMEDLKDSAAHDAPTAAGSGVSNLANTIRSHRANYKPAAKADGKKTQNNGDYVARVLLNMPLADILAFVGKDYSHLNPGHQRMCAGNHIRAWYKKNDARTLEWLAANDNGQTAEQDSAE